MIVLILLRAGAEILNQCLKAFRLFMHNLTPTTALDVRLLDLWGGRANREGRNAESTAFLLDDGGGKEKAH